MSRRNQQELATDVLRFIAKNGPAKTTHVIFGARLGYKQFLDLSEAMLNAGLIRKHGFIWSLTDTGRQFLEAANAPILNIMEEES